MRQTIAILAVMAIVMNAAFAAPVAAGTTCISTYAPTYRPGAVVSPMKMHVNCHSYTHSGGGVSGGGDESSPDWAAIGIVLLGSVILGIVVSNAYANHVDEEGSSARAGVGQGGFWGEWKLEW